MVGGVISCATVTVNVQVADSRQEFVARQVTGVVPRMNTAPDGGVQVTTAFVGQRSVVVGAGYLTTAVLATPQIQLVWPGGQLMRRGVGVCATTAGANPARNPNPLRIRAESKTFNLTPERWRADDEMPIKRK
jgi:hypothetical protein